MKKFCKDPLSVGNVESCGCMCFFFYSGLLGGHFAALVLKNTGKGMSWYNNELLAMAEEIGYRLLPAFNTTTGIPYPRVSFSLLFYAL